MLSLFSCTSLPAFSLARASPAISRLMHRPLPRAIVLLKKAAASDDEEQKKLLASLTAGMNSWSNFDAADDAAKKKKPPTKNAAKASTKRKGKDGKIYLRDGPKRKAAVTKLSARRKSSAAGGSSSVAVGSGDGAAAAAQAEVQAEAWRVRIEESKKVTLIRGLEAMPVERATSILKHFKQALAVGGRIHANGEIELQGAHAERIMLRLQKEGFTDVKLSGGAGGKKGAPAWNAPKEIRERAEATKRAERSAKKAKAADARAARKQPAAVAEATLRQLRASEEQAAKLLRRSDLPAAERQAAKAKMERIQRRLAEL